jgi:regulator of protease activity HflC (stomatin/prohibitin superfamily)
VIVLDSSGGSTIYEKGVYKSWGRDKVYFVDQKLKSFNEPMEILCADDINMTVDVKCVLSFDVTKDSTEFIKRKVPTTPIQGGGLELSLDQFYQMAVRDVVRGSGRNVVSVSKTDDIRPNRQQLEAQIQELVIGRIAELKYPVKISAVLISNIDYPETVKEMRNKIKKAQLADQEKAALAEAMLAEAKRQVAIEQEQAKVRMVKAQAQADENRILTESLTPQFLMWRQFEVMENLADKLGNGTNNTVFMMPYQTMNPDMLNTAVIRDGLQQIKANGTEPKPAPKAVPVKK